MKKIEIIVKPEKIEEVKNILNDSGVTGIMITSIMGYGNQKGHTQMYRGTMFTINLLPKMKIETVVPAAIVDATIDKLLQVLSTDDQSIGGGKIFITEVEEAIRIRTGEKGEIAL